MKIKFIKLCLESENLIGNLEKLKTPSGYFQTSAFRGEYIYAILQIKTNTVKFITISKINNFVFSSKWVIQ